MNPITNKIKALQNAEITKSVVSLATIQTSSDLIFVMNEVFKRTLEYPLDTLKPIIEFESENWRVGYQNVAVAEKHIDKMCYSDCIDAAIAYKLVTTIFLENESYSKQFKLDERDHEGWAIYKELNQKRDYANRAIAIKLVEIKGF